MSQIRPWETLGYRSWLDVVDELQAANALAKAAKPLIDAVTSMSIDHKSKLVDGQTFESAQENWDKLIQEPLDFKPLMNALAAYEKVRWTCVFCKHYPRHEDGVHCGEPTCDCVCGG